MPAYQTLITAAQLRLLLDNNDNLLIADCRTNLIDPDQGSKAYLESHIPGAVYLHLDQDLSSEIIPGQTGRHPLPEQSSFTALIQRLGINENTQIVVYDSNSGAFAARAWWLFRWAGLANVAVLDGGWQNWVLAVQPTNRSIPMLTPSDFEPSYQDQMIVSADEILSQGSNWTLLDARAADRFAGQNETLDPKAGHIPGTLNAPFSENLDEQGMFLPGQDIAARFTSFANDKPKVNYCGSGVTACHNILAMTHAGLDAGRLYPGSWSEWITDDGRNIET